MVQCKLISQYLLKPMTAKPVSFAYLYEEYKSNNVCSKYIVPLHIIALVEMANIASHKILMIGVVC